LQADGKDNDRKMENQRIGDDSDIALLPELVEESRKQKGNISLKTIPVNSSAAWGKHRKQPNKEYNYVE